jgi:hypothetical protein
MKVLTEDLTLTQTSKELRYNVKSNKLVLYVLLYNHAFCFGLAYFIFTDNSMVYGQVSSHVWRRCQKA